MDERLDSATPSLDLSRRELLQRGALLGGAVWAAPVILSMGTPAFAMTPQARCTGYAYDLRVNASGLVAGHVGPVRQSPPDQHHERECFADVRVNFPEVGEIARAEAFCVENDFDGDDCRTIAEWAAITLDLNPFSIPVQLQASILRAEAVAACGQSPQASSHLASATLTVSGNSQTLAVAPPPNTGVSTPADLDPLLNLQVILNRQQPIPGGIAVDAVYINAELLDALGSPLQQVEVILSHARADVHDCP